LIRGNLDRASSLIESAKPTLLGSTDRSQKVFTFVDEVFATYLDGWLEQERGDAVTALAVLKAGINICEKKGYPAAWATLWALLLGRAIDLSLRLPSTTEAELLVSEFRERLERIADRISVAPTRALALRAKAAWEIRRGNSHDAVRALEESVVGWRQVGWPYELAITLYGLGVAYQESGDPANADRALSEALEVFTRLKSRREVERVLGRKTSPQA
jgi:tetratricopeptide (TPR) repeat protein